MKKTHSSDVIAGCFQCSENDIMWRGPNVAATARVHAKTRDHSTWVERSKATTYNPEAEFRRTKPENTEEKTSEERREVLAT
jgi:hypothetical protein